MRETSALILDANQLAGLQLAKCARLPGDASHVVLDLPELTSAEAATWANRLNGYYRECGCTPAAIVLLASLAALALGLIAGWVWWDVFRWSHLICGLLLCGFATGAAKCLGVAHARRGIRRTLAALDALRRERGNRP